MRPRRRWLPALPSALAALLALALALTLAHALALPALALALAALALPHAHALALIRAAALPADRVACGLHPALLAALHAVLLPHVLLLVLDLVLGLGLALAEDAHDSPVAFADYRPYASNILFPQSRTSPTYPQLLHLPTSCDRNR